MTTPSRWNTKKLAISRAKRSGSSAPTEEELIIYKKHLQQTVAGKKNPRVLVLGATPELRDMAIALGCNTLAVDISPQVIQAMREIMTLKDSPRNQSIIYDWLKMKNILPEKSFDACLADVSLNNLTIKNHAILLKDLTRLLKSDGQFITRNVVFLPELAKKNLAYFQQLYNQQKTSWIFFWIALGYYTKWQNNVYNQKTKEYSVDKLFDLLNPAIQKGEINYRSEDLWKIHNVEKHGRQITHYTLSKGEFEELLKKYFVLRSVAQSSRWHYSEFAPIYVLKNNAGNNN